MKSKKNTNTYRYELNCSFKVEDSWFESLLVDTLEANDLIDAYSKANEIVSKVNQMNDNVNYRLAYLGVV